MKSLTYEPKGQIARWMEKLASYNFIPEHRPGRLHLNADGLSRPPFVQCAQCQTRHRGGLVSKRGPKVIRYTPVEACRCKLCMDVRTQHTGGQAPSAAPERRDTSTVSHGRQKEAMYLCETCGSRLQSCSPEIGQTQSTKTTTLYGVRANIAPQARGASAPRAQPPATAPAPRRSGIKPASSPETSNAGLAATEICAHRAVYRSHDLGLVSRPIREPHSPAQETSQPEHYLPSVPGPDSLRGQAPSIASAVRLTEPTAIGKQRGISNTGEINDSGSSTNDSLLGPTQRQGTCNWERNGQLLEPKDRGHTPRAQPPSSPSATEESGWPWASQPKPQAGWPQVPQTYLPADSNCVNELTPNMWCKNHGENTEQSSSKQQYIQQAQIPDSLKGSARLNEPDVVERPPADGHVPPEQTNTRLPKWCEINDNTQCQARGQSPRAPTPSSANPAVRKPDWLEGAKPASDSDTEIRAPRAVYRSHDLGRVSEPIRGRHSQQVQVDGEGQTRVDLESPAPRLPQRGEPKGGTTPVDLRGMGGSHMPPNRKEGRVSDYQSWRETDTRASPNSLKSSSSQVRAVHRVRRPRGLNAQPPASNWMQGGVNLDRRLLQEEQMKDPACVDAMLWIQNGQKPTREEIMPLSGEHKFLWGNFDTLAIEGSLLVRHRRPLISAPEQTHIIIPATLRRRVISLCHDSPISGHFYYWKTLHKVKQHFVWPGMTKDLQNYCRACHICATKKKGTKQRASMRRYDTGLPMEEICIDLAGAFPESELGNKHVLVVVDSFTKWMEAYPIPDQFAETVADALVKNFVSRFGLPFRIKSDRGRQFESECFEHMCTMLDVDHRTSTAFHPQGNSRVERMVKVVSNLVSCFCRTQKEWDNNLPLLTLAYRSSIHEVTGYTPNYLMMGREVYLPLDIMIGSIPEAQKVTAPVYVSQLKEKLQECFALVRTQMKAQGERQRRYYNLKTRGEQFEPGQMVYLLETTRKVGVSPKLAPKWKGPFMVAKKIDTVYEIQIASRKSKLIHFDLLKACHSDTVPVWIKRARTKLQVS